MQEINLAILDQPVTYEGQGISVRIIEETIHHERGWQNEQVAELAELRGRNEVLQGALSEEIGKLRELSDHLNQERNRSGFVLGLRSVFAKLPWFQGRIITRNSIEELLRAQYELSARRLKEAAEFVDRLEVARANLYDEIERLNEKIIESARNEEKAETYIAQVQDVMRDLTLRESQAEPGSARARELQARLDQTRRLIVEHSGYLRLYSTAEERLDRLKENTRQLAETIGYLRSDITLYVTAASEKLDIVSGQIQAIGAAADASVVMLELKHSLEAMTEAINHTTRFVSETQAYFRQNVDQMLGELELYDEETVMMFDSNLMYNEVVDDLRMTDSVTSALGRKIDAIAAEQAAQEANQRAAAQQAAQQAAAQQEQAEQPEQRVVLDHSVSVKSKTK